MTTAARKTVSHAAIYGFGDIIRNIVSIVMLPIYTRFLTPADYGIVELLNVTIDFVSIVLGLRLGEAIFRFYCNAQTENDKKFIISTALVLSTVLHSLGVGLLILFASPISTLVFGSLEYTTFLILFSWTLLMAVLNQVPMIFVRAEQRPWLFLFFSTLKLVLQVALNIYFVVIRQMHVEGVIYSSLIASGIMAVVLCAYTLRRVGIHVSLSVTRRLVSFSAPIMLATIGAFYLTFGDRYFLRVFSDLSEVGIYSLGYKFGFILGVLTADPFNKIWDSQKYEVYRKDNAKEIYQTTFVFLSLVLISVALGLALFAKDLLTVMADPAFVPAHKIIPIIVFAYVLWELTFYCNFGLLLKDRTGHIAYASLISVVVVTIAYLTLIPPYGALGAAVGTALAFAVQLYWINRQATKYYDMELPWRKIALLGGLAIGIYSLSGFAPPQLLPSVLFRSLLFAGFFLAVLTLPILTSEQRLAVLRALRHPRNLGALFRSV